jgi:hypothetical protein
MCCVVESVNLRSGSSPILDRRRGSFLFLFLFFFFLLLIVYDLHYLRFLDRTERSN